MTELHRKGTVSGENMLTGIGENIRKCRKKKGLTQKETADRGGISQNYLSMIETGEKVPTLRTLGCLSEILNTTPGRLIDGDTLISDLREMAEKHNIGEILSGLQGLLKQNTQPGA